MMKHTLLKSLAFNAFMLSSSALFADMHKIKCDANKRIRISIGSDSLNRIAIEDDRIVDIFGDEEAFTMSIDEGHGQAFLKASESNGSKPISLSIMTENGLTQDVELIPTKESAQTIILTGSTVTVKGTPSY